MHEAALSMSDKLLESPCGDGVISRDHGTVMV